MTSVEACALCRQPIPAINDPRFPDATDEQTELELLADGRRYAHAVCAERNGEGIAVPRKQFDLFAGGGGVTDLTAFNEVDYAAKMSARR